MSRLPASRWARIGAWTGAAIAWGTTIVVVREMAPADAVGDQSPGEPVTAEAGSQATALMPAMPDDGLVILRYVPVPDPEPKVVTRYVEVTVPVGAPAPAAPAGGGAKTTAAAPAPAPAGTSGGGTATVAPPPPPPPAPTPTTAPPAPVSGGS